MDDYENEAVRAVLRECESGDASRWGRSYGQFPITAGLVDVLVSLLDADDRAPDGECHVCGAGAGERHSGNCPFAAAERARVLLDEDGVHCG